MICPFCLHKKSEIYNSRSTNQGFVTWRRRRCLQCQKVFTTQETYDPSKNWYVVKDKSRRDRYSRAKLAMSLVRACDHRLGQQDDATWYLFEIVEQKLLPIAAKNEQHITAATIIEQVSAVLKRFDAAAYVKYLSYHQPPLNATALRRRLSKN